MFFPGQRGVYGEKSKKFTRGHLRDGKRHGKRVKRRRNLLSFAQGGPLDFSKGVGTGGMRVAGDGRLVRLPETVSRVPLDGALRQYSTASGLAGEGRVGAGTADVSAASRGAIRALPLRTPGLAGRRHQLDAGLSARRPALRPGAPPADADSRAQRGAAEQPR